MSENKPVRYHPAQVSLHWLTVALLVAVFLIGKIMSGLPNDAAKLPLLGFHVALGAVTLVVIVARFIVRFRLSRPVHAATGSVFLDWLAGAVHYALYALLFLMTLSGMALSLQAGLLPVVFGGSGAALPADFYAFGPRISHGFIATALLLLSLLHIGAALYHQFILKDNLLARMWYGGKRK